MGTYDEIYRVIDGLFLDKKEHSIQEIRTLCEQQGILLSDRNAVNNVVHKLKVRNRLEPGSEKSFYRIPEQGPDQEPQEGGQKPAKRTAFSGIQTGEKADGIDWNRFFVLEPQSRQALEKRFTLNQKGEIRFNSNLTKAVSSRKLELIVSRDCRTILLNPAGPQAHEFTKAGTTRNQALADMLAKMRLSFPVTYTVRWDEGCEMWRGDINISPKK